MTIIFGFKQNSEVWLASDRYITEGDIVLDSKLDSKLIRLNNAIIGAAGDITIRNHLELFISLKNNINSSFETKNDVIHFFINFKRYLTKVAGLGEAEHNQIQELHGGEFLVATKDKLFQMDEDCGIMEFDRFTTVGRGGEMALALLEYIFTYKKSMSPADITKRVMKIVCKYQNSCGGKATLLNVSQELVVQNP